MTFHDEYKPFRNYMRRFDLLEGLQDVWRYSLHIMEGQPLPADYAVGKEQLTLKPVQELLHPWQLDVLARELVLNGGTGGDRSLKRWNDLAVACNHILRLEEVEYQREDVSPDVLFDLHRMVHRQFPWQADNGYGPIVRSFKIYGDSAVDALILRELGMTMRQFLLLGSAVTGHFMRLWGMSDQQDYWEALEIPKEASTAFFGRVSTTLSQLSAETAKRQVYGDGWQYTWSPLEATPLVRFDPASRPAYLPDPALPASSRVDGNFLRPGQHVRLCRWRSESAAKRRHGKSWHGTCRNFIRSKSPADRPAVNAVSRRRRWPKASVYCGPVGRTHWET